MFCIIPNEENKLYEDDNWKVLIYDERIFKVDNSA